VNSSEDIRCVRPALILNKKIAFFTIVDLKPLYAPDTKKGYQSTSLITDVVCWRCMALSRIYLTRKGGLP